MRNFIFIVLLSGLLASCGLKKPLTAPITHIEDITLEG